MKIDIPWAKEYGDEDKWGKFAGRFVGYDPRLTSPSQRILADKPIILLMADSIFGGNVWKRISDNIKDEAYLNYIQHPHHAGTIQKWLNVWNAKEWDSLME